VEVKTTTATKTAGGLRPTWSPNKKKGITVLFSTMSETTVMMAISAWDSDHKK